MAKTFDKTDIVSLNVIRPYHVSQSVDAFTGIDAYDITLSGSFTLTGSLKLDSLSTDTPTKALALSATGEVVTGSYTPIDSILWETGSAGSYSVKVINDSTTDATGNYSYAEGLGTTSSGLYSHSEGGETLAEGTAAHSEGYQTTASGDTSHAEGYQTHALGETSHAEGDNTVASGTYSHSEGYLTSASGDYSHAEGKNTIASGSASHAEGDSSTAIGTKGSHAEGNSTIAYGVSSHAEGSNTIASGSASHAEGSLTLASGSNSHAEGVSTSALGINSHAEGDSTIASGGASHAEGESTIASGDYSHAEGSSTWAEGDLSHAQGQYCTSSGVYSHAGGYNSWASGSTSFVHSYNSKVTGDRSVVLGGQNITGSADDTVYVPHLNASGSLVVSGTQSTINNINRILYTFQTTDATPYVETLTFPPSNSSRYIKAIVTGFSITDGGLGGEFTKIYSQNLFLSMPSIQLSSTGTLADSITAGIPTFSISSASQFTATGIAGLTINWTIILEINDTLS